MLVAVRALRAKWLFLSSLGFLNLQFYFGDKNLPRDTFLRQKAEEDQGCIL